MADVEYKQEIWSLEDLFSGADTPEWTQARESLEEILTRLEGRRDLLSEDISEEQFLEILDDYEALSNQLSKIIGYGYLRFAQDTQDQEAQGLHAQSQQLQAEVLNRTLFFELWWKGLEDKVSERLMEVAEDRSYFLEAMRLSKPFTLSEPEEKVINLKNVNGSQALYNLYQTITYRYLFNLEVEGEIKELTRGELSVYVQGPDPDLRKAAYQELFRVFGQDAPILGQIYQYRLRDWRSEYLDLRGYASPIAVRNLSNDVPDDVIETLLNVCRENASVFQRYFEIKAEWLGMEKLRRYDIYAPLAKSEKTYPYEEAVSLVLESFQDFEPRIAQLAQRVLDEKHIDAEIRKGKDSGAFCMTVTPNLTPWVLANYNGRPTDVGTIAHELGHAIHSMLAEHHSGLTFHATLPLAETASTFAEMILMDRLIELDPDPEVRRDLLINHLNDAYATVGRQSYFALFEKTAHKMVTEGATVDDLSAVYMENLQEQFGSSLDLSDDFREEWVAIPHFYDRPFYVYAYAFGQLLVLSLYQQYKEEGDSFKPRYIDILAAGGSESPMSILDKAGIDVREAAFWQGGFDVIKDSVDQLEAIEIPKQD
jgi:oligoendopeptidase F